MWLGMAMLGLASCASGPAIDPCGPWRPILVSREDGLTDGTARQVLVHNQTGRRLCGW
jgi:hypothetical protein